MAASLCLFPYWRQTAHSSPWPNILVDRKVIGPGELNDPNYQNMHEDRGRGTVQKLRKSYGAQLSLVRSLTFRDSLRN